MKCGVFLYVYTDCGLVSLARLRPVRGRRTRIKYVIGLMGLAEAFHHSWYQSKKFLKWLIGEIGVVEEMIQRKAPSAPVPPVAVPPGDGEAVPVAPVPPRVEVPFLAPVPPPPPVLIAEEPVMQVKKFLRLQPPTYSGGPNPDTAEHWVHEIERVFATMRCPAADRVVKSRVGPEMKQDLLLFSWSWRPGVAVDWLASRLVDVDCLNLAAVDVDAKGGGESEEDVSRPSSSSGPRRSGAGSVPPTV
ncbi:hypothetical protein Taro_019568 [Colocasia esculenta]|uniref:Uncharacterized protein n=1 Tax=Colocasia esculenta TaxID=4460 RepID=A0A843ULE7_COLES|nr:hypothetical protein [Colocasia esculenta]